MGKNINPCGLERKKEIDSDFIINRLDRLMQVSQGRWLARTIGRSPALIYQWKKINPRSLPTPDDIWKLSSIESVLFGLNEHDNFRQWLVACGYDTDDEMVRGHLNWLKLQGQEITIKFPDLK